ncbi:MAG TPA: winged helix-turn-helix domain-containing protein [Rhizomicrobium sp.]|nr:winged helix-turn-helix domain-containing protein [Rhizomicrobium sp.]
MAEPYYFDRFTVDPVERRLCEDGVQIPLGSTDFRILLTLLENAGAVVTKEQLVSRVWGPVTVTDNVLYVHINALRRALGNDRIRNEQRHGYRFVSQVRRTGPIEPPQHGERRAGNLPSLWTGNDAEGPARLIGRSEQLRIVSDRLAQARLLTLTGPGGVGKTRLALQAASEASSSSGGAPVQSASLHFGDGAWLVSLATLNDPDLVPGAIASALGIQIGAKAAPLDTIARNLAGKSLLIVLDNCEHVTAAAARTAESLLAAAAGVTILATSREPLSCFGEQVLEIPPLDVPGEDAMTPDLMRRAAAVDLFIERAMEADANFRVGDNELPIVAKICRRLDGLPLAIEMAAGWAGALGLQMLDAKLDGSLNAWLHARSTAPPRHCTLRATLEWSSDLLSASEQAVLGRLAVFAGSFTIQAAEILAGDGAIPKARVFEHVANLKRKSMIAVVPGQGVPNYRMLETTRAFALEKLAARGEADSVRRRHAHHVLCALELATSEWETTSDAVWLERHGPLLEDLRAALSWAMNEDSDDALMLAGASWPLWRQLSLPSEGRQRLSAAAARLKPDTAPALEARLRRGLGEMLLNTAAATSAHEQLERATHLYRSLDDAPCLGSALGALGFSLFMLNRIEEAERAIREALRLLEPAGWLRTLAMACSAQLCIEAVRGRFDAAFAAGKKAERLCGITGADRTALNVAANLVQVHLEKGEVDNAIRAGVGLVARLRATRHSDLLGFALGILAAAFARRGDLKEAMAAAREAVPRLRDDGRLFWLFDHLGLCAALHGRARDAALIAGYADSVHRKFDRQREPMGRCAMERTTLLLRDALPDREVAELSRLGARLSEDQAIAIALSV